MRNKKFIIFGVVVAASAIATAVSASWAGYKTREVILKEKLKTKKEIAKKVWKYYVPAGIALGLTIISDVAVLRIGLKEMAALGATISYLTLNKRKLEERVKDMVGEEKWKEIKNSLREEQVADEALGKYGPLDIQETGYGNTLCRFSCSYFNIWFRSDPTEVMRAIEEFQHRWANKEYLGFIEDLLDNLHIHVKPELERLFMYWGWPASSPGCCPGFDENCPIFIDTDVVEGYVPGYPEETLLIDLSTDPYECYMEY